MNHGQVSVTHFFFFILSTNYFLLKTSICIEVSVRGVSKQQELLENSTRRYYDKSELFQNVAKMLKRGIPTESKIRARIRITEKRLT